jgi:glucans biosynthesis protein
LPPAIAKLTWDQWQSIRFRDDHSLWFGEGLRFRVQLFHLGFTIKKPVRIYSVENAQAQELSFDPGAVRLQPQRRGCPQAPATLGFAGFRLLFHGDWKRDIAAFQGASYFRAVDGELQYGMSQRGLAIDCGCRDPRSFQTSPPTTWNARPRNPAS